MSNWVYVLRSQSTGRHYCGQTNSLALRIKEHNTFEYFSTETTKRFDGPWELIWSVECETRKEAMQLERKIKKRGIARYLDDKG